MSRVYRFIECKECGRAVHRICVLYLEHLWPSGFMCDNCRARNGDKRPENKFVAKRKLACSCLKKCGSCMIEYNGCLGNTVFYLFLCKVYIFYSELRSLVTDLNRVTVRV